MQIANQDFPSDTTNICIAIGVSKPERLEALPGAITAAESIAEWARCMGYQTALVTDENEPVTCSRLKTTIEHLIAKPEEERGRIIISFAGHGVISGTRDLWLLSSWYTEPEEIVDVELMRMRLASYRPRQVTIISDACRTPPPEDDPTIQGSRILSRSPWEATEPDCDVLLATGIGRAAFMVRAKETRRAYCLFTHVVANTLWGRYAGAVDQAHSKGPAVTSQTLKTVLRRELPLAANLLNQSQSASIVTNFTPPDDIYTSMSKDGAPPSAPVTLELSISTPEFNVRGRPSPSSARGEIKTPEQIATTFRKVLENETPLRPTHFETGTGLAVVGERIASVASAPGTVSFRDSSPSMPRGSQNRWWILDGPPTSLAVQLTLSGRWLCSCIYPGMIGTFTVGKHGTASLVFRPGHAGMDSSSVATEEAVAAMHAGTVSNESALEIAATIRERKHIDPVLGVIASYLYANAGDFESVRRIAWFYCHRGQPIPFDVALIGGLKLKRNGSMLVAQVPATSERAPRVAAEEGRQFTTVATSAIDGTVAGGIPWLRQGWSLLEDSREPVLAPLLQFTGALTPAMFTTLEPAAGEAMAELIQRGENLMNLIFVHGINHQGQTSDIVRDHWLDALRGALDQGDFEVIVRQNIIVPYYGDVLWQHTEDLTVAKDELQPQSAAVASGDEAEFYRSVLTQLADNRTIPVADTSESAVAQGPFYHNRRIIALARAVQAISPLHGRVLLRLLPQAFTYLSRIQATTAVDDIVRPVFQNGPSIVVAHSLGTIVAYKLLRELRQTVPLYLTIGSPLAVAAVQSKIGPPLGRRPAVNHWRNFFDQDDFVTIGKPLNEVSFGTGVGNNEVDNGDDDPHDFRRYLSQRNVSSTLVAAIRDAEGSSAA